MSKFDGNSAYPELATVFKALEEQFDTSAHQRKIEELAQDMTMRKPQKSPNCSCTAAPGSLYHEITGLNRQFPKFKRGNDVKKQTPMIIVEKYEWSRSAEENVL